ncbi:hypothetical protein [Planococcus beigongshangi]|uniref:hypothetical protein n=1 Tax=Planococcus beigongshangi TaxID=2782536 RepID=UPI00193B08FD|nr:hypothetical protein [Planococcus beigongshangi]
MRSLRLLPLFCIGMALTALLLSYGLSRWLVFTIVIGLYLIAMVLPGVYAVYFSNSIPRIGRYIKRNRFKPIFAFPYALGNGSDQDVEAAIEQVLKKHKQPELQSIYRTLLALHRGQAAVAVQHAETIEPEPLRSYYLAQAAVASGDLQRAQNLSNEISESWMKHSIEALIARETNEAEFLQLAEKSVQEARGVQKYTLQKNFERVK